MVDTSEEPVAELRVTAPHRELLDQVLDKWSLSILNELCERPCRFNDLRRAIPTVTQKSLTATLRRLERSGIRSIWPSGQTVSKCPSSSTCRAPAPNSARR